MPGLEILQDASYSKTAESPLSSKHGLLGCLQKATEIQILKIAEEK